MATITTPGALVSSRTAATTDDELMSWTQEATREYAMAMASPPGTRGNENAVFAFCASHETTDEKLLKNYNKSKDKITRLLQNNSHLFKARSRDMGQIAPNDVAAHTNHVAAARLLLELGSPNQLLYRDLQGKTALHIAAERGQVEMVEYLRGQHEQHYGPDQPLPCDLVNQTALGAALTSPDLKARKNHRVLYEMLYTPADISILGTPAPAKFRCDQVPQLQLVYGYADKPGRRVRMEDAMIATLLSSSSSDVMALFGVCDGHSDNGLVSNFLAQEIPAALQLVLDKDPRVVHTDWNWTDCCTDICLSVDAKLKDTSMPGGSTAVCAIVTSTEIVVANVGDSRCILIQKKNDGVVSAALEGPMRQLTLEDEQHSSEPPTGAALAAGLGGNKKDHAESLFFENYSVIALSNDHKPNLVAEKSRVEAAGLSVVEESFMENNQETVLSKIKLSDSSLLATSRSFGDFEYKANSKLGPDQQAVVAVPEVLVHRRSPNADAFLVLACDGVWDAMSNEQVGQFVVDNTTPTLQEGADLSDGGATSPMLLLPRVADLLTTECLQRGSQDNLSVIIVALAQTAEALSGGGLPERQTLDFSNVTSP